MVATIPRPDKPSLTELNAAATQWVMGALARLPHWKQKPALRKIAQIASDIATRVAGFNQNAARPIIAQDIIQGVGDVQNIGNQELSEEMYTGSEMAAWQGRRLDWKARRALGELLGEAEKELGDEKGEKESKLSFGKEGKMLKAPKAGETASASSSSSSRLYAAALSIKKPSHALPAKARHHPRHHHKPPEETVAADLAPSQSETPRNIVPRGRDFSSPSLV